MTRSGNKNLSLQRAAALNLSLQHAATPGLNMLPPGPPLTSGNIKVFQFSLFFSISSLLWVALSLSFSLSYTNSLTTDLCYDLDLGRLSSFDNINWLFNLSFCVSVCKYKICNCVEYVDWLLSLKWGVDGAVALNIWIGAVVHLKVSEHWTRHRKRKQKTKKQKQKLC